MVRKHCVEINYEKLELFRSLSFLGADRAVSIANTASLRTRHVRNVRCFKVTNQDAVLLGKESYEQYERIFLSKGWSLRGRGFKRRRDKVWYSGRKWTVYDQDDAKNY